ncbi:hypothetical protein Fmac_019369 [Flemingia macrophylla]|uniref:FAS1 domain-containing protein n=1 Tax=Flemingia macrophylla TaxID=520843 RepID=A0ABD1M8A7_9FABA
MAYSRWCWFPLYFAASIALGVIAISSATRSSSSKNPPQEAQPIARDLSVNASNALRRSGFIVMADLLHHSPSFFNPPQNSTIFAIKDSAIKNTSHPLWFLKTLLLYHTTATSKPYTFNDLLHLPLATCLPTLLRAKNLSLTKLNPATNTLEINHVPVSNPNIFLSDKLAIHGVLAPFYPLLPQDILKRGFDSVIPTPTCRFNQSNVPGVDWNKVVRFLSANGYASFSVALHSVLDGIKKEWEGLSSVTVFSPPDLTLLGYPSKFLDRAVRLHILPRRFSYKELTSLPVRTLLKTLVPYDNLEVDGVLDFVPGMVLSGVEIVAPDLLASHNFVVHGICRAFKMTDVTL